MKQRCAYEHKLSEVEVVAHTTRLIVDDRMSLCRFVLLHIAVGIHHARSAVGCHAQHTLQGVQTEAYGSGFKVEQHKFSVGVSLDVEQSSCRCQTVGMYQGAVFHLVFGDIAFARCEKADMLYCLALSQFVQRVLDVVDIAARHKAVYFLSHI